MRVNDDDGEGLFGKLVNVSFGRQKEKRKERERGGKKVGMILYLKNYNKIEKC